MDGSEGKSPRPTQWGWFLPESEGNRGEERAQSERDNEEATERPDHFAAQRRIANRRNVEAEFA